MSRVVAVHGADTVARTMHRCADDLRDMSGAHASASAILSRAVVNLAPVATGRLAQSVSAGADAAVASVNVGVPYALPVEFGSRRRGVPGRWFVRRAVQTSWGRVFGEYDRAVTRACDQVRGI